MDQTLINWIMAGFGGLIGFFLSIIWNSVKDLQTADKTLMDEVSSMRVLVAGDYVRKSELAETNRILIAKLDRIEEKIDKKADK